MLAALGLFDLLSWLLPLVVAFLFWRRVGRFMNTVEARAVSLDERLERLEKLALAEPSRRKRASSPSSSSSGVAMNDRDRALLELAAQSDRERDE
ncbi:MAG: hypothetical protein K1X94_03240 [Sandaracinaceae bacterium]|nr:hypothetical protein [Sandaracinaceae bacterium]